MRIRLRLFAGLAEACGAREMDIELPAGSTAGAALAELSRRFAAIAAAEKSLALAVNDRYADRTRALEDGDRMALIPPVSGG